MVYRVHSYIAIYKYINFCDFYKNAFGIGAHEGIRTERYKLIHFLYGDYGWELYDLLNDPEEIHNIYSNPDTDKLRKKLNSEMEDLKKRYDVNN